MAKHLAEGFGNGLAQECILAKFSIAHCPLYVGILLPTFLAFAGMTCRMKKASLLIAIILPVALTGCASKIRQDIQEKQAQTHARIEAENAARYEQQRRDREEAARKREEYLVQHPELSEADRRAVMERRPIVGLTFNEAWFIVGGMVKVTETGGVGGHWAVWRTVFGLPKWELYFREGRLVRWIEL